MKRYRVTLTWGSELNMDVNMYYDLWGEDYTSVFAIANDIAGRLGATQVTID